MNLPQRSRLSILLVVSILAISAFIFLPKTRVTAGRQAAQVVALQSARGPLETGGPTSALITSPNQNETVYLVNGLTGEVGAYKDGAIRSYHSLKSTGGPLAVQSSKYVAYIDGDSKVVVAEPKGRILSRLDTPTAISVAILGNRNIVVASTTDNQLLHLYTPTGRLLRRFGNVKPSKMLDRAETQFLNKGKLLVDGADNIYYVYHYVPLIQVFSPTGEMQREIRVEGPAIDLQQELAQRFLSERESNTVGGVTIINSAAIDPKTGHLWIGLNGSSITGTVYEYGANGEKLQEYALELNPPSAIPQRITGVRDIAITGSKLYVATNEYQVFEFERSSASSLRTTNELGRTIKREGYSISPVAWMPRAGGSALAGQGSCGTGQNWGDCGFSCPGPVCSGNTPTATSSNNATLDCKTALAATLTTGYVVVSANCTQYPAGTQMHMRGGCFDTVRICREGVNSDHSLTLDCQAPTCSGGGDEGGGGGPCPWESCGGEGYWDPVICACEYSPILIDTLANGFDLTSIDDGVNFDLKSIGVAQRMAWTAAGSDDAFLALDRNGNGRIDNGTELFGSFSPQPPSMQPNGFIALAEYDRSANGGNSDGIINRGDGVFASLRLWQDTNHNGVSEASELHTLPSLGVYALDLDYKEARRRDGNGNWFRYRAKVFDAHGAKIGRWVWDVYLLTQR